jgi:hypothetical protein
MMGHLYIHRVSLINLSALTFLPAMSFGHKSARNSLGSGFVLRPEDFHQSSSAIAVSDDQCARITPGRLARLCPRSVISCER